VFCVCGRLYYMGVGVLGSLTVGYCCHFFGFHLIQGLAQHSD